MFTVTEHSRIQVTPDAVKTKLINMATDEKAFIGTVVSFKYKVGNTNSNYRSQQIVAI